MNQIFFLIVCCRMWCDVSGGCYYLSKVHKNGSPNVMISLSSKVKIPYIYIEYYFRKTSIWQSSLKIDV